MSEDPIAQQKIPANIADEMRQSYMDYAMSVIIGRALPDVRDGLKPANRRVLYGMQQMGLQPGRPYRKSAKVAGEVMGNYHPHGEGAIYDTLVRMAQDRSEEHTSELQSHSDLVCRLLLEKKKKKTKKLPKNS